MELIRTVFSLSCLVAVLCRRPAMIKPHRDVRTTQGVVRGYLTPTHAAYYGIPYAETPKRSDRYKAPEPPPTWDSVFEASHHIKCPQSGENGDENCLVINVFAPRHAEPLPVYVLVHEGDFNSGWGTYQPPEKFLREPFVVVTFNYRIGALGFLCLNTPDAPGNAGLKDQIAALRWIQSNIEAFGGNPEEVIVHGIGSAAVSIQFLLLSGLVEGLIHKVVVESGSVLSPLSLSYDPIVLAYEGAVSVGYEGNNDAEHLYKFYRDASIKKLINIQATFVPCVEDQTEPNSVINFDPIRKLEDGDYQKVPIMITYSEINDKYITEIVDNPPEEMLELMPNNLEFDDKVLGEKVAAIVKKFYFGDDIFSSEDVEPIYLAYNFDLLVEYPVVKFAMLYADNGPHIVYLMHFTEDNESSSITNLLDGLYRDDHDDINVMKLVSLWRNFMNIGDPTPLTTGLIPIIWQPVFKDKHDEKALGSVQTLHFGDTTLRMSPPPPNQKLLFWNNIYNRFYKPHVNNRKEFDSESYDEE